MAAPTAPITVHSVTCQYFLSSHSPAHPTPGPLSPPLFLLHLPRPPNSHNLNFKQTLPIIKTLHPNQRIRRQPSLSLAIPPLPSFPPPLHKHIRSSLSIRFTQLAQAHHVLLVADDIGLRASRCFETFVYVEQGEADLVAEGRGWDGGGRGGAGLAGEEDQGCGW